MPIKSLEKVTLVEKLPGSSQVKGLLITAIGIREDIAIETIIHKVEEKVEKHYPNAIHVKASIANGNLFVGIYNPTEVRVKQPCLEMIRDYVFLNNESDKSNDQSHRIFFSVVDKANSGRICNKKGDTIWDAIIEGFISSPHLIKVKPLQNGKYFIERPGGQKYSRPNGPLPTFQERLEEFLEFMDAMRWGINPHTEQRKHTIKEKVLDTFGAVDSSLFFSII